MIIVVFNDDDHQRTFSGRLAPYNMMPCVNVAKKIVTFELKVSLKPVSWSEIDWPQIRNSK